MVTREPLGNLEPLYGNVRHRDKGIPQISHLEMGLNLGYPRGHDIDKRRNSISRGIAPFARALIFPCAVDKGDTEGESGWAESG